MKILAISHLYPHANEERYGIFVARQLQAMAKCGAEITLLVPRAYRPGWLFRLLGQPAKKSHVAPLCDYPGVNAIPLRYWHLPGAWYNNYRGIAVESALRGTAERLHRDKPFDVIYATNLFLGGDAAVRLAKRLRIPATCLAIGTDVNTVPHLSPKLGRTYQHIVTSLDGTLACGESIARKIDERREDRSLCVYGVVDLDLFRPITDKASLRVELGLPVEKKIILYVGYLETEKGVFELLQAFERVHSDCPDAVLVLCGEGADGQAIKQQAAASNCSNSIQFIGPVPPDQIQRYYQASDVFTLPSYAEGMPNAVMEAMACGSPVVATTVGGLPDALENCEAAILVPPKQSPPLAAAIVSCLDDPDRRRLMERAAVAKATQSFGAIPNAQKILDYLATIAGQAADER